jgi:hypothetical protein
MVELDLRARIYSSPGSVRDGRAACLTALVADIVPMGARRLVIEGRESMDHLDEVVLLRP